VQGAASFVAGQVAKTGDMKVGTPVASMGIRGTAVILDISSVDGKVSISVVDQRDGQVHAVQVFNTRGVLIGTVTSSGSGLTLTPTATFEVIAQESNKTVAQVAQEFNAFQTVLQTYDAGKVLFPDLPQHTDANPQSPTKYAGSPSLNSPATEYHSPENGGPAGQNLNNGPGTTIVLSTGTPPAFVPTGLLSQSDPIPPIFQTVVPVTSIPFVVTSPPMSRVSSGGGDHFGPVMSADGRFVTYDPDGAIYFFDRQSGSTITIASPGSGFTYSAPTISSDGRFIVYQGSIGTQSYVFIYNNNASDAAHYGQTTQLMSGGQPAISGDGSTIVVEQGGSSIGIFDLQGNPKGTITPAAISASGTLWKPAISADGHVIAFWSSNLPTAGGSGQLFTYDLSTGTVRALASTATDAGTSAASFSADGRYVVYQSDLPGGHSEISLYDLTTGQVVFHTANAGASYNPVISPDGHFIIFASDARLTSGDTNSFTDIYVVDVTNPSAPVYKLGSALADGTQGNAASNLGGAISTGGLFIAFGSSASNFSAGDTNGGGDIFVVDPSSGRSAIIQETASSPSTLKADGVIVVTGGTSGVQLSVSDPSKFSADFSSDGKSIVWHFSEPKSDFASLPYGQDSSQLFVITLTAGSGGGTTTIPVTVTVHNAVQPIIPTVDAAPVADPVTLTQGQEDASYTITAAALLAGVHDIDGPSLFITAVTIQSGGGTIAPNPDGSWTYTPASNYSGPVVLNYTASDGTKMASSTASLNLVAIDHAPTDIALTNSSIAENTPPGTVIGTLSAIDPDLGDTATFTLIDDAGGRFALNGNKLVVAGALDYESATSHQITVRATDSGGLPFTKTITIGVIDVPGVVLTGDAGNNTLIGTVEADTLSGLGGNDVLQGLRGHDFLDGGAGRDFAVYTDATAGITVNLAAGTVHGAAPGDLASIGTDTLRSIEYVRGSNFNDNFVATGFSTTSTNASSITSGSVNNGFEGMEGDDVITGNGGTQIWYKNAFGAVTVDFLGTPTHGTAQSTAPFDAAGIGHDTFTGVNSVRGSEFNDTLLGSNTTTRTDVFYGGAGNDFINGRGGFDLVVYSSFIDDTVTGGVTINLALGTVVGNPSVGSDTLHGVELVRGSNFNDSFTAVGFSGASTNAGSFGTFNDFEGMDGDDSITGNGNTRVSYSNATAAVTIDLADESTGGTGTARDSLDALNNTTADLATVGVDTFHTGINAIRGSDFDDRLLGSNTLGLAVESFIGGKGDDFIDGRGGYDRALYSTASDDPVTGGITVDMAAGKATGDASVGTDTLKSVELIRGSNYDDIYNAVGFDGASSNAGSDRTFNEFEGMGGNDTMTGNGNTQIAFYNSTASVTVDLADPSGGGTGTAKSTAAELAGIGHDRIDGGVNSVVGSQFDDFIYGSNNPSTGLNERFEGRAGDDFLDGRGGFDVAVYYVDQSVGTGITVHMAAGTVDGDATVGHDTLRAIESVTGTRFTDTYDATGFGDSYHLLSAFNNVGSFGTFNEFQGYGGDDLVTGNGNTQIVYYGAATGVTVDLADTSSGGTGTAKSTVADAAGVGHDTIYGGVNAVRGSSSGDILSGNSSANILDGQGGNDVLDGRGGNDLLIGGTGADTFVYAVGGGIDRIADFNRGEGDRIDLTGVPGVYSLADILALATSANEGANTRITFGEGDSLTLSGVSLASLVASDFVFSPAPNHPPVVVGGTYAATEDTPLTISNLAVSDVDSGSDPISVTLSVHHGMLAFSSANGLTGDLDGSDGTVSLTGSQSAINAALANGVVYAPESNYNGLSELTVVVNDQGHNGPGGAQSVTQQFAINVSPVNDVPTGTVTITGTVAEDQVLTASNTLADADGLGTISYQWQRDGVDVAGASGAAYTLGAADVGHTLDVVASYTDGQGTPESVTSAATAAVTNVNDPPSGADKTITTIGNTAYTFTAADFGFNDPNDSPANSLLAVKITTLPTAGSLINNGVEVTVGQFVSKTDIDSGKLIFTPSINGHTGFTFQVQDNGGTAGGGADTDPIPDTMTFNHAPTAVVDSATVNYGAPTKLSVLTNDIDPDGDPLTISSVTAGAHGTTVKNSDNTITYTATAGYVGPDSFQYMATDGRGGVSTAAVTLNVQAPEVAVQPVLTVGSNTTIAPTDGSALKTTLQLNAGDVVTFDWNFTTDDYLPYKDFAFATVNGAAFLLSDIQSTGSYGTTGWQTFSYAAPTSGSYTIGQGIMNDKDQAFNSYLAVDNVRVNGGSVQSFENVFSGSAISGDVSVVTTAHSNHNPSALLNPTNGTHEAFLTSQPTSEANLETFLGLSPGRLVNIAKSEGPEFTAINVPIGVSIPGNAHPDDTFVTISGAPAGSVFNHGVFNEQSGTWRMGASDLGGNLTITTPSDYSGSFTLTVTATSVVFGSNTSATTPAQTQVVTVDPAPVHLIGTAGPDVLKGGSLDDIIDGGPGSDTLTGGGGKNTFVFHFPSDGVDTVTDFHRGSDVVQISAVGFGGGLIAGQAAPLIMTSDHATTMQSGTSGYFIYESSGAGAGTLYWDQNGGSGANALALAHLNGVPALSPSDFHLV
jgi:Tol biopolymer transport system component